MQWQTLISELENGCCLFQEQSESEEENLYKLYVEKARDRCNEYNLNHGRSLNRLALNALNAVNVISQDGDVSKIAYVWAMPDQHN